MKAFKIVYVVGMLLSMLMLCAAFGFFVYTVNLPPAQEQVLVYEEVIVTKPSYIVITATPQPTPAPQEAVYQPRPTSMPMTPTATTTPACVDKAEIVGIGPAQVLTTRAVSFKATIQNVGTCTWRGYKFVSLSGPFVELPFDTTYPNDVVEIEFALSNPPPGHLELAMVVVSSTGLLLFDNSDDGLLHVTAAIPMPSGDLLRANPNGYKGGGNANGVVCVGGR